MDLTESNTPQIIQKDVFPMAYCPYVAAAAQSELQARRAAGGVLNKLNRLNRGGGGGSLPSLPRLAPIGESPAGPAILTPPHPPLRFQH